MHNTITTTQINDAWNKLGECFDEMKTKIAEAGKLVCWLLDNDPDARDKFRKAGITPQFYNRLDKVGRGVLLPELAEHSQFQRLPLDEQRKVVAGDVTAVVEKPDGTFDTVKVDVMRARVDVYRQVIAGDHIRTPEEQRRFIEKNRNPKVKANDACKMPWRIVGRNIEFIKPCVLTRADMLSAMRAMEA